MEIVYFYHQDISVCPVKEYLSQYLLAPKDKEFLIKRKAKILADIDAKISYIGANGGRPRPPFAKPLRSYSCFEILNSKDTNTVIRILYFTHQNKMILLHAFEKPANYSTERERKRVEKQNKLGEKYLNIFKLNPNNYEKYE